MSAPDTNIEKQATRHRGPLIGIAVVVGAAALLFLAFVSWTLSGADDPEVVVPAPSIEIEE